MRIRINFDRPKMVIYIKINVPNHPLGKSPCKIIILTREIKEGIPEKGEVPGF